MEIVQLKNTWIVKLQRGEEVITCLQEFMLEKKIKGAEFNAIGAVENPELGYFDINKNTYLRKKFDEPYEVINLSGNLGWDRYNPIIHAHVSLGANDFSVIGGHLFKAVVSVTLEIFIRSVDKRLDRLEDDHIPLKLLDL